MEQFSVTGMTCAACSAHVEKAVAAVPGVKAVSVSLLTNSMGVDYAAPATAEGICKAVADAGYGASPKGAQEARDARSSEELADTETPVLKRRLIASLCFLLPLMYVTMGHMVGLHLPAWLEGPENAVSFGLTQLLLTLPVLIINNKFFVNGAKSLWRRAPSMDALVALGAGAAVVYGVFALYQMSWGTRCSRNLECQERHYERLENRIIFHFRNDRYVSGLWNSDHRRRDATGTAHSRLASAESHDPAEIRVL